MVELSVFMVVAGCLWSSEIKDGWMTIFVFMLLKVPHVLDSDDEDTTLRIVLHSVWMGPFLLGVGFNGRSEGQYLR